MTRHEVTGQRDDWLSLRHRGWGPMYVCDIDSIGLEHGAEMPALNYHFRRTSYFIDYKTYFTRKPHDASTDALVDAGNHYCSDEHPHGVPVLVVLYAYDKQYIGPPNRHPIVFKPIPKNEQAELWVPPSGLLLSERSYVRLLYRMKGLEAPNQTLLNLSPVPMASILIETAVGAAQ
jgi:hypothetical protein